MAEPTITSMFRDMADTGIAGIANPYAIEKKRREEAAQMDALADRIVDKLLNRLSSDETARILQGMIDKHGRG